MIIGSKEHKNKKVSGELKFSTGKRVYLSPKEWQEFKARIHWENQAAVEKYKNQQVSS